MCIILCCRKSVFCRVLFPRFYSNYKPHTTPPLRHADNTLFFYSWQSLVAPWNESYRCKNITVISVQHKHQHINTLSPKLQGFGISRIYSWIYWLKRMKVKWFYLLLNSIALIEPFRFQPSVFCFITVDSYWAFNAKWFYLLLYSISTSLFNIYFLIQYLLLYSISTSLFNIYFFIQYLLLYSISTSLFNIYFFIQ